MSLSMKQQSWKMYAEDVHNCHSLRKNKLYKVLSHYPTLFDGELWKCPYFKVHLELQQNAIPYTGKVYDVPYWHCEVSKRNLID